MFFGMLSGANLYTNEGIGKVSNEKSTETKSAGEGRSELNPHLFRSKRLLK
jgi:hypothetical protein